MTMLELHLTGRGCGNCRTPWGMSALWCKNVPKPLSISKEITDE